MNWLEMLLKCWTITLMLESVMFVGNFFVLLFWEADAVDRVFNRLPLNKMVLINVVIVEALKYGVS